jgi:hypothetical protein
MINTTENSLESNFCIDQSKIEDMIENIKENTGLEDRISRENGGNGNNAYC